MITTKLFNQVAQGGHFCAGLAAVWGGAALFGRPVIGALLITTWAAVKEFWYDKNFETEEVRGSDLEDFLFYTGGAAVALGALWLQVRL